MEVLTEWLVTNLIHYWNVCCYIIGYYIIGKFRRYIIGAYFVTYNQLDVTLSVDVILSGVVTLSGSTG